MNRGRNAYDYLKKRPSPELYPIPIIVVNWHGTWELSHSLHSTVIQHPIYRALAITLPEPDPHGNFQGLLKWAMSSSGSAEANEETMAELAERFKDVIHDGISAGSSDEDWLRCAKESGRFNGNRNRLEIGGNEPWRLEICRTSFSNALYFTKVD